MGDEFFTGDDDDVSVLSDTSEQAAFGGEDDEFFDEDEAGQPPAQSEDAEDDEFGLGDDDAVEEDDIETLQAKHAAIQQTKHARLKKMSSQTKNSAASGGRRKAADAEMIDDDDDDEEQASEDEDGVISHKTKQAVKTKRRNPPVRWGKLLDVQYAPNDKMQQSPLIKFREHCAITHQLPDGKAKSFTISSGDFFLYDDGAEGEHIYRLDICALDVRAHHSVVRAQLAMCHPDDADSKKIFLTNRWRKFTGGFDKVLNKLVVSTPTQRVKTPEYKWANGYIRIKKDAAGYEQLEILDENETTDTMLAEKHYTTPAENSLLTAEKKLRETKRPNGAAVDTPKPRPKARSKKESPPADEARSDGAKKASRKRRRPAAEEDDEGGDDVVVAVAATEDSDSDREKSRHHRQSKRAKHGDNNDLDVFVKNIKNYRNDFTLRQLLEVEHWAKTGLVVNSNRT